MHIILDLDGTLVNCTEDENKKIIIDKRPYLEEFFDTIFEICESVSIWSAGDKDYVHYVLDRIKPLNKKFLFIKTSDSCTKVYKYEYGYYIYLKKLGNIWKNKTLGLTKSNTIIIEDTPTNCIKNYGNSIYIPSYAGNKKDEYLLKLIKYIKWLNSQSNIRFIEKRFWYNE